MIPYEKYSELRRELQTIRIDLDPDPAATGIGQLNEKIAEVHALKDRVSSVMSEAIANVAEHERKYQESKIVYECKFDAILNNTKAIQEMKSDALRRAAVNAQLPDEFAKMNTTKIDLGDAEAFQKLVQAKYNLLDSANTNISRQISVIQLQMDVGEINRASASPFRERTIGVKRSSTEES